MIEIKQQENQLSVYFNQQLIIKHTDQQPAFFLLVKAMKLSIIIVVILKFMTILKVKYR